MQKIRMCALTILLVTALIIPAISTLIPQAAAADSWTSVADGRAVRGYTDLKESVWQKNASMAPNGPYDKIGLHRLVKTGITPKGVVFLNPGTYGNGEILIKPPSNSNDSINENYNQLYYWANRGYDVYAIDYRTHFVPATLNTSQLGFMAQWGYDQWISDIREAVLKTKEVSGASKVFMAGQSFGGRVTMYYAAKYWQEDLRGIILLDGSSATKYPNPTNSYNLTATLAQNDANATWAFIAPNLPGRPPVSSTFQNLTRFAVASPGAPANIPGTNQSLPPSVNPLTGKAWTNITEWMAYVLNGPTCNLAEGYGNVSLVLRALASMDRYWPDRLNLEQTAIQDWTNSPYVTFDYDEYFKNINVPLIGFTSELYGIPRFGGVVGNIGNSDVTKIVLPKYGHMDVFMGTYSARDINEPVYQWMLSRYRAPAASAFCNVTLIGGGTWYFSAHSNGGIGSHSYQWYEGSTLLAGQTSTVLPVTKTSPGVYTFYCKVTDSEGTTTKSNNVTLTVLT